MGINKKKILVTGGTGYIGSHTVVELQNAGFEVVIVDNLSNSNADVVDRITKITGQKPSFYKEDCLNKVGIEKIFANEGKIDGIIHFAAKKAVNESVQQPLLYYRNNILSLVYLLETMQQFGVQNIVFSSSCTVYGQPDKLPVTETAPIKTATSPYGNTKQMCEEIIHDAAVADANLNGILLRYFNPIGAHPSALIGELPNGVPMNLVPFITQTAAGIRPELKVFGDDYSTPDGSCIRDYINVVDLAKAHVVALNRMIEKKNKQQVECFNIGTGRGLSVLELIKTFQEVNELTLPYKIVGRREGDIEQIWADPTYANEELGWKAVESIEDTLRSAWKWQKQLENN